MGGKHRGRRLTAPEGLTLRPTADRTREAVFNILTQGKLEWRGGAGAPGDSLAGIRVLDAFAGTGALGLEALSRGAGQVTFMENQAASLTACRNNIHALGEEARAAILACDVLRPPRAPEPCALVLMDPPYNQDLAPPALRALVAAGWLTPGALVTVELMAKEPFTPPEGFEVLDERKYGKARVVFLLAPD
ncbi:MAG: 16S rRNA (guanine(966)-N(2))-methyltransferase RsmD [Kiloniellales bacterium]